MIRRSVVLKLWLTIVLLVLVVLAILALYLEQFFASYITSLQRRDLTNQIVLAGKLLANESPAAVASQVDSHLKLPLHDHYYLASPPWKNAKVQGWMRSLPVDQQASLLSGVPLIKEGVPPWVHGFAPTRNLYAVMPVKNPSSGSVMALLVITNSQSLVDSPTATISGLVIFAVILGTLLTTGLAFVISKNLSRPLLEMNAAAEEMAKGRFDLRVRVVTQDEVGRLGQTLNHVAAELEMSMRALTLEKEEVAGLLEAMTDAVVASDTAGRVTLLNPTARSWLRLPVEGSDAVFLHEQLPPDLRELQADTLQARQWLQRELTWQNRIMVATMAPLFDPDHPETLRGTLAVIREVTQERQLERLRKDFVANVSHELRTPLSMLQGYTEALLDEFGDDPEQRFELTQIIHDETLRMRRLVNELLDLAQLESGHFSMNMDVLDAVQLVQRTVRKFQGLFSDRGMYLRIHCAVSQLQIYGDPDRLEQVFTNLLDNALRHTLAGGVTIRVQDGGTAVIMIVQDTGQGIGVEDLPFVFERFYKVDKARTRSRGGTGLGLSIAQNLIRAHHGEIDVQSTPGVGTTFFIRLPKPLR